MASYLGMAMPPVRCGGARDVYRNNSFGFSFVIIQLRVVVSSFDISIGSSSVRCHEDQIRWKQGM